MQCNRNQVVMHGKDTKKTERQHFRKSTAPPIQIKTKNYLKIRAAKPPPGAILICSFLLAGIVMISFL